MAVHLGLRGPGHLSRVRTAAGSSYPPAVVANGLQAVWDLRTTAGIRTPPTKFPGITSLPAGWTISQPYWLSITITQSGDHSGWDFTGYHVNIWGNIDVSFTDCKFSYPTGSNPTAGQFMCSVGYAAGGTPHLSEAANVTFNYCTLDGADMTDGAESAFQLFGAGHKQTLDCHLTNFPRDIISGDRRQTIKNNFFEKMGMAPAGMFHLEVIHLYGGDATTSLISENLIDTTDCPIGTPSGIPGAGWTGTFAPTNENGSTPIYTIEKNIVIGKAGDYVVSAQAAGDTVAINGNVFEKGATDFYAANGATVTSDGLNRNLITNTTF